MTGIEDQHLSGTTEWQPDRATLVAWKGFALLLLVVGLVVFGLAWAVGRGDGEFNIQGRELILGLVLTVLLTLLLMALHEGAHGLAIRGFAGAPVSRRRWAEWCPSAAGWWCRRPSTSAAASAISG